MEVGEILVDIFMGENKSLFLKRERALLVLRYKNDSGGRENMSEK